MIFSSFKSNAGSGGDSKSSFHGGEETATDGGADILTKTGGSEGAEEFIKHSFKKFTTELDQTDVKTGPFINDFLN